MSTGSLIAKKVGTDRYRTIFCACDGYLSHNGKILSEYYTTPEQVEELLALGDLYYLGAQFSHETNPEREDSDVTLAFTRDYGDAEEKTRAKEFSLENLYDYDEASYIYIFAKPDKWIYCGPGELDEEFRDVKKALEFLETKESPEDCEEAQGEESPTLKL